LPNPCRPILHGFFLRAEGRSKRLFRSIINASDDTSGHDRPVLADCQVFDAYRHAGIV